MTVTRREAIRRLAVMAGGTVSAPTLAALLSGCEAAPPPVDWTPTALTGEQYDLLTAMVDRIIPTTDTPGAVEAGVPAFIDKMLADWMEDEDRDRFLTGLSAIDGEATSAHGAAFLALGEDDQVAFLTALDEAAVQARTDREDPLPFFAQLKEWTLAGYYTSEVGATEELQWLPAPGRYATVPVAEVGRAWSS